MKIHQFELSALILLAAMTAGCERKDAITGGPAAAEASNVEQAAGGKRGTAVLEMLYKVQPNDEWQPGQSVILYADARRNPNIGQEDIFQTERFPRIYARPSTQRLDFTVNNVKAGEKIIVQGYICSEEGGDCYPSDKDNPPSCSVEVHIRGNFKPSCHPVFVWTGGTDAGGVLCRADCL